MVFGMDEFKKPLELFSSYLKYEKNYSRDTLKNYRLDLEKFMNYLKDLNLHKLPEVTSEVIQNYINMLNRSGLTPTSLSKKASSIRSLFSFLYKKKLIDVNPSKKILVPKKIQKLPHKVTINMTWNLLCVSNILEFIDEMMDNGVHPNQFIMNYVNDPIEQSVLNITNKQRNILVEEIQRRKENTNEKFFLFKVYEEMIEIFKRPLLDTHKTALYNMLMDLDIKRKLNSKEVLPELYKEEI